MKLRVFFSKTYNNLCIGETPEAIPSDWPCCAIRIGDSVKIVMPVDLIYIGEL